MLYPPLILNQVKLVFIIMFKPATYCLFWSKIKALSYLIKTFSGLLFVFLILKDDKTNSLYIYIIYYTILCIDFYL